MPKQSESRSRTDINWNTYSQHYQHRDVIIANPGSYGITREKLKKASNDDAYDQSLGNLRRESHKGVAYCRFNLFANAPACGNYLAAGCGDFVISSESVAETINPRKYRLSKPQLV